ncbi:MAG: Mfa1 family fimbria major subunit [Alistipes finegoldii]
MKTKSIIAGMLSTMLLAVGCNKEDGGNRVTPEAGVKTYASFSVSLLNQSTRAASTDPNAVTEEIKIHDLYIYIFNGGVLETKGQITLDINNKGTTALATTTGTKTIYAVPNYNAKGDIGSLQSDFEKQLIDATDIAEENGFFMAGKTEATLTERTEEVAKQEANLIQISVARGAAKVQMQFGTNVPVKPVVNATVTNARFTLAQQNSHTYLAKLVDGVSPKGKKAEQLDDDNDGTYDHLMKLPTTDDELKWIDARTTYQNTYATSKYLAENVNQTPTTGNTSYVLVSLQVTPQAKADGTGAVIATPLMPGTTFYVLAKKEPTSGKITFALKDNQILYFEQETDATTYKTAQGTILNDYEVLTYTNGISYYRLNIRDIRETDLTKKYAVNRNHYYKVNITEISNLGFNTAAGTIPTDPTTPLETQTFISADITIEAWTVVDMNEPLG